MNLRDPPAVTAQILVTAYFVANILRDIHPLACLVMKASGCLLDSVQPFIKYLCLFVVFEVTDRYLKLLS